MRGHVSRIRWVVPMVVVASLTLPGVAQANHSLTAIVSTGPAGGNGAIAAIFRGASDDGTRVFFQTAESLVSADTDTSIDVYERSNGTTTLVSTGPNGGNGPASATYAGASADGTHVFFRTAEQLVGADTDNAVDIYERFNGT